MRRTIVVIFVLLAIVLASSPTRAVVDAPRWAAGDFWEYSVRLAVEEGLVLNGTLRATVAELGTTVVKNVTVAGYRATLSGTGVVLNSGSGRQFHGRWTLAGEEWVEPEGFQVIRSVTQVDANGTAQLFGVPFWFQVQNTTENAVIADTWRYPLDVGKAGVLVTNTTFAERVRFRYGLVGDDSTVSGTYSRTLAIRVTNATRVAAPAGAFDALEVSIAWPSGETDRWFYASAVGNNVHTEAYNATGQRVAQGDLVAYRYQAGEVPAALFGLPPTVWLLAGVATAAAASAVVLVVYRRRRERARTGDGHGPSTPP